jgi:hypothetical protein
LGAAIALAACAPGCGSSKSSAGFQDGGGPSFCPNDDCDGDGYPSSIDCNDTDPNVNPDAYDFSGDGIDNDCDGVVDDPVESCETVPSQAPGSPGDFARAADLCPQRSKTREGKVFDPLIRAEWGKVKGYGPGQRIYVSDTKMQQVNIVSSFGANQPRRGRTMIGLATGPWNAPDPRSSPALDEAGFHLNDACGDIPLAAGDCAALSNGAPAGGVSVQDWAELRLWLKVPSNARSLAFDLSFFSTEFNQFWNASLNDTFLVLVTSKTLAGQNMAKDGSGRAISVNSGFFQLCPPAPGPPGLTADKSEALQSCVGIDGDAARGILGSLRGTGYDGAAVGTDDTVLAANGNKYVYGGGTGWLTAKIPVVPRDEIQVRVIVHDTFDGLKDSAVLVDAFRWMPDEASGVARPPPK